MKWTDPKTGRQFKAPSREELEEMALNCYSTTPDGCVVEVDGCCPHGQNSWFLILGLV